MSCFGVIKTNKVVESKIWTEMAYPENRFCGGTGKEIQENRKEFLYESIRAKSCYLTSFYCV